nr:immunoglobulin heavy chain junction region [Mus musculus]
CARFGRLGPWFAYW